jgi:hypothetical protein
VALAVAALAAVQVALQTKETRAEQQVLEMQALLVQI